MTELRAWPGHQIGGQHGQLAEGTSGQRSFQALIKLVNGQAAIPGGGAQDIRDPVFLLVGPVQPGT